MPSLLTLPKPRFRVSSASKPGYIRFSIPALHSTMAVVVLLFVGAVDATSGECRVVECFALEVTVE